MSIKILDTFSPAGDFELASAKDIKYQKEGISVEKKLEDLTNLLTKNPEFSYVTDIDTTLGCPVFRADLNSTLTLEFNLTTPALGNCYIKVDRAPYSSEGFGTFIRVREFQENPGRQNLSLGTVNSLGDYVYRISATDSTNKTAKYFKTLEDDTVVEEEFIYFRVICGGIQFSSDFTQIAKERIFKTEETNISYKFQLTNALESYRWLFYTVTQSGELPSSNLKNWLTPIFLPMPTASDKPWQGGSVTASTLDLIFSPDTFKNAGNYDLHVCAVASPTDSITTLEDYNSLTISTIQTDTIEILDQKTIALSLTKKLPDNLTKNSYLGLKFVPKTTVESLNYFENITIDCITYLTKKTIRENAEPIIEREYKNTEPIVGTQLEEAFWNIGTLAANEPDYTYEFVLVPRPSIEQPLDYADPEVIQSLFSSKISLNGIFRLITIISNVFIGGLEDTDSQYVGFGNWAEHSLEFYFDANKHSFNESTNTWNTIEQSSYSIRTENLNKALGIQTAKLDPEDPEAASVFKFAGNAYGMLYKDSRPFNPWELLNPRLSDVNKSGLTFEAYLRSDCIGTLTAQAVSARKVSEDYAERLDTHAGFSINYESARTDTAKVNQDVPLLKNTWQHITIVLDPVIRTFETGTAETPDITHDNIEDLNPYRTLRTYVDGVLVSTKLIEDADTLIPTGNTDTDITKNYNFVPLVLNGVSKNTIAEILTTKTTEIINQGECEIRLLRCYSRSLKSSEVYKNYLSALTNYARPIIKDKNKDNLLKIYFTKNKQPSQIDKDYWIAEGQKKYGLQNGLLNVTFSKLNTIKSKADGAKTHLVNCTMHYFSKAENMWKSEPNVDVYLQGTSTLTFPVKNYKIKVFDILDGKRVKKAIPPPTKTLADGWYTNDNVYTLKCDYMEQSHRNNTPTACYYQDRVLDAVIASSNNGYLDESKYSPARKVTKQINVLDNLGNEIVKTVRPYRDAIDGFACIVYYCDNGCNYSADGSISMTTGDLNEEAKNKKQYNTKDTKNILAGSYMFNIDKEGKQLGFELDLPENTADTTINIAFDETDNKWLELPKAKTKNLRAKKIPCISYEGSSNHNMSAGAFIPWEKYQTEYNAYVIRKGWKIQDDNKAEVTITSVVDLEDRLSKGEILYVVDPDIDKPVQLITQSQFQRSKPKADYFAATLPPRYTFADDLKLDLENADDLEIYNDLTYSTLDRAINWVYDNADDASKFTTEFSNYFSFEYCLAYYLQMMLFAQVDNAGKNAMFDVWFDPEELDKNGMPKSAQSSYGKLFPRPYDMDTQMGLDNSGEDKIPISAELNLELCPAYISGSEVGGVGEFGKEHNASPTWQGSTSRDHDRFSAYNTSESKLWIAFGKHFKDLIKTAYANLRTNGVYSVDAICDFIDERTSSTIGETFYNKDAALKYLSYKDPKDGKYVNAFLTRLNGNRKNRFKQFLEQRIIFLDTVYGYEDKGTTNTMMSLRVNTDSLTAVLGIQVYSPQYIRLKSDQSQADMLIYADPSDTYLYQNANNKEFAGTLIRFPTTGNDKNVYIYGAANINKLNHTRALSLSYCDISAATKLTEIDISGSETVTGLTLGQNSYIRKLDISGTKALRGDIDLKDCLNLESFNAASSAMTGLTLKAGANIKDLNLTGTGLTELVLDSHVLLTSDKLLLNGCNKLTKLVVNRCPLLGYDKKVDGTSAAEKSCVKTKVYLNPQDPESTITHKVLEGYFDLNHLKALSELQITNCDQIKTVDLTGLKNLTRVDLSGDIETIDLVNCAGTAFSTLNLTGVTALSYLDLNNITVDGTMNSLAKVYLPSGQLDDEGKARKFKYLNLKQAKIDTISKDPAETTSGLYDFTDILFEPNSLTLSYNELVSQVKNLIYTGSLSGFFRDDKKLTELIDCKLTTDNTSLDNMFYSCSEFRGFKKTNPQTNQLELDDFTSADWNLDSITSAQYAFYNTGHLMYDSVKAFMTKLKNVENLTGFMQSACIKAPIETLEADFFKYNEKITNLTKTFYACPIQRIEYSRTVDNTPITLFYPCRATLSKLTSTFASAGLLYAPSNLLKTCTALSSTAGLFSSCTDLGNCADNDKNSMLLTTDFKVFNDAVGNSLTDISGMFFGCENLQIGEKDLQNNTLIEFFKPLTNLTTAKTVFYYCNKLTSIPENLFRYNTKLENINGMFISTALDKLPNSLFPNEMPNLTSARSLFANCYKMEGYVSKYFFENTPNLAYIGSASSTHIAHPTNALARYAPGMFANTNISGFHIEFLAPLGASLKNASKLFFNSPRVSKDNELVPTNAGGTSGNYLPAENSEHISQFKIIYTLDGVNDEVDYEEYSNPAMFESRTTISELLFKENTAIENVESMFVGNHLITNISENLFMVRQSAESQQLIKAPKLSNTSCMFLNCTRIVCPRLTQLLQGLKNLTHCSHMFANCNALNANISDGQLFKDCNRLVDCCGFLMNTSVMGNIPVTLFESCRSTISDVSYFFAGCKNLNGIIETGHALINDPNELEKNYISYLRTYLLKNIEKVNTWLISQNKDSINSDALTDLDVLRLINELEQGKYVDASLMYFDAYSKTQKVVQIEQRGLLSDCLALTKVDHMFSGCENLTGPIPADMFYLSIGNENSKVTSLAGLFECCYKLTMHSSTTCNKKEIFGTTTIKYKVDKDAEISEIAQLGGGNYSNVYPAIVVKSSEANPEKPEIQIGSSMAGTEMPTYLVPNDWLRGFIAVEDISRIFYNVGTLRLYSKENQWPELLSVVTNPAGRYSNKHPSEDENDTGFNPTFTYAMLQIPPRLFADFSSLSKATAAFAHMNSLILSDVNESLFSSAYGLSKADYIFYGCQLHSTGYSESDPIFKSNYSLTDIKYAFFSVNALGYSRDCYFKGTSTSTDDDISIYEQLHNSNLTELESDFNSSLANSYLPVFTTEYPNLSSIYGAVANTYVKPYYKNGVVDSKYSIQFTSTDGNNALVSNFSKPSLTWSSLFRNAITAY